MAYRISKISGKKQWFASEENIQTMHQLKKLGYPYTKIGDWLGCSDNTVAYWLDPKKKEYKNEYHKTRERTDTAVYDKKRMEIIRNDPILRAEKQKQNNEWAKRARRRNPARRLYENVRRILSRVLGPQKVSTDSGIIKYVGCTKKYFFAHMEAQFYPRSKTGERMSFDNHGRGGWEVDHIIAIASAPTREKALECLHYTNLQPLWIEDHKEKSREDMKIIINMRREEKRI